MTYTLTDAVMAAWAMDDELQLSRGEDIRALRDEARSVGDDEMVAICQRALRGDRAAIEECALAISEALAQIDA